MKDIIKETLAFTDLTPEEKERRGILGRLYGPCADIQGPTRNDRFYPDELWEKVFNENEIVKELLANGGIPGEAQHPADRTEIDTEKIAIMMPEAPKKDNKGHLIGYWDILDTPCGRIVYQLAKYGFKLGISSRGTGDVYDEGDGEVVDPSTYDFSCFDLVIIPAVKDARLTMAESLDKNMNNLKSALTESLNKASIDEKRVMEETLKDLHIKLDDKVNTNKECINESCADKLNSDSKETLDNSKEANNDGSDEIIKSLQEALKENLELKASVKSLQEQLAVSDTKVNRAESEINRSKSTIIRLTDIAQNSKLKTKKIVELEESLKKKEKDIERLNKRIKVILEGKMSNTNKCKELNESINSKDLQIKSLNENLLKQKQEFENKNKELNEKFSKLKEEQERKLFDSKKNIIKFKNISEGYRKLANKTVDKYIELKSIMLNVTPNEIKNKLSESYTLEEVDKVCESLKTYELNISKLPFNLNKGDVRVKINESKKPRTMRNQFEDDDNVDSNLLNLADIEYKK